MGAKKITAERETVRAAAYIRMSRDSQAASPERQKRQIEEYAARNNFTIVRWYADHGLSGTRADNRKDYQQLLSDVSLGAFDAVLIAELSRMSRQDIFSAIPEWGTFRDANVRIVSCSRGEIDFNTMGGVITAVIDQFSSHDEVRKFADRSVTGKLNKAAQGLRISGTRVFGYNRQIIDSRGKVIQIVRYNEKFTKSIDTKSVLIPADDGSAEAVVWAFDFVKGGGSLSGVARELNKRGLRSIHGKEFNPTSVHHVLTNPVYIGSTRAGFFCRGKFRRMDDHQEPTLIQGSHIGLIDKATFEAVSERIDAKSNKRDKWDTYLLSGLCYCEHCGQKMAGKPQQYKIGNKYVDGQAYCCRLGFGRENICGVKPQFRGEMLEAAVLKAWADVFLVDETQSQLKAPPSAERPQLEQQQLQAVRQKIENAERNLANAEDKDDFRTVSSVLKALRKEEADLRNAISRASRKVANFTPDIMGAIARLQENRDILERWATLKNKKTRDAIRAEMMVVLKATVCRITLRINNKGCPHGPYRERHGILSFNPEVVTVADVVLTDDLLSSPVRRVYRKVATLLKEVGKPMTTLAISKRMKKHKDTIWQQLRKAEAEGLVKVAEGGWVACG